MLRDTLPDEARYLFDKPTLGPQQAKELGWTEPVKEKYIDSESLGAEYFYHKVTTWQLDLEDDQSKIMTKNPWGQNICILKSPHRH